MINSSVLPSSLENFHSFKTNTESRKCAELVVYDTLDWVISDTKHCRFIEGKQTLELSSVLETPAGFSLSEWIVDKKFPSFTFFEFDRVIISTSDGYIYIRMSKNKINVTFTGAIDFCYKWNSYFQENFKKAENLVRWVYNTNGDDIRIPLNYRKGINAAYPWLGISYEQYIKNYLKSDACVLILIGPPGTGKTTFIKNIIHQIGSARVAYDEKVLSSDDFFASFVDSEDDILVMEDADAFLKSREDGNTMMHKFLNVSDGLISAVGKKIVFSTNLPNINDIDEALLRTGRCYDTVQFRPLNRVEAQAVLDEVGSTRTLSDAKQFTLAQIFSEQPSADKTPKHSIGFTS
ncbi:MAG: hypothetical protein DDT31_00200 [Syntrophomonadaceae bacterium]|nr:hypothetical protein [Bacillota bacterium]